jgi:hypothetical protein
MTGAQQEFVRSLQKAVATIVSASGELDAIEGLGPGGEHAVSAALSAIDAAIQVEKEFRPRKT